jgi:hypothetical protein
MTACPREQIAQHVESPGLVGDDETVCRGAYDPMHFNTTGVRAAVIRPRDLIQGELSVWRLERDPAFDLEAVANKLIEVGPPGNRLREVLAATVGEIREMQFADMPLTDKRVFCVLDDCATDEDGGWHREHATVGLAEIEGVVWAAGTNPFDIVREGLVSLLKSRVLWADSA